MSLFHFALILTGGCVRGSKQIGIETVKKNNGERIIK